MRFSILQLMAFAVLAALIAGLIAAAREHGGLHQMTRLRFTSDGEFLTGVYGERLQVWKRVNGRYQRIASSRRIESHFDAATWEVLRPDGRRGFVFQVYDQGRSEFRLEQVSVPFQGGTEREFKLPSFSDDVSFSHDGERFAIRIGGSIALYGWESTEPVVRIPVTSDWQADTCLTPSGDEILHVDDDSLRIWNSTTGKLRLEKVLPPEVQYSRSTAGFSGDGRFVCVFRNRGFHVYDTQTLDEVAWPLEEDPPWNQTLAGLDPWDIWMPGSSARLVSFRVTGGGDIEATVFDLDTIESHSLTIPVARQDVQNWIGSIALSPDERWCAVSRNGRVQLVDTRTGASTTIFYPRPLLFTIIYSSALMLWAVVWGRLARRAALDSDQFARREPRLGPGAISGAFQVLGEGVMMISVLTILVGVGICAVSSLFGPIAAIFVVVAILPAVIFFVYRGNFTVGAGRAEDEDADEEYAASSSAITVPSSIVAVWIASAAGGLVAIAAPTIWMMYSGSVWYPFWFYSILVGVAALAQASSCSVNRLGLIAWLQLGCILSCDGANFLIGCGALVILQRSDVREFRQRLAKRRAAETKDPAPADAPHPPDATPPPGAAESPIT